MENGTEILQQAIDSFRQGDLEKAEILSDKALKDLGEHADAQHLRGVIALHKGELKDAEKWIRKAITLQDSRASFWSNLGSTLSKQQRWSDAISALKTAQDLAPKSSEILLNLGITYEHALDLISAERVYRKALSISPKDTNISLKLAQVLHKLEKLKEAKKHYCYLLQKDPVNIVALNNMGNICFDEADYNNALKYYEKSIQEKPENPSYHLSRARCLELLGKDKEALKAYENALTSFPNVPETVLLLANAHMDRGNVGASRLFNQKALEIHPDSPTVINNYGHFLMFQELNEDALPYFDRALAIDPVLPEARHNKAKVLYKLQRFEELKQWLKELLKEAIPPESALILQAYVSYREGDQKSFTKNVSSLRTTAPFEKHLHFFDALQECKKEHYQKATELLEKIDQEKFLLLGKEIMTLRSQVSEMVGDNDAVFSYAIQQKNIGLVNSKAHLDLLMHMQLVQLTFQKDWIETWEPYNPKDPSPSFLIRISDGTAPPLSETFNRKEILPYLVKRMEAAGYEYPHGISRLRPSFIEELTDEYWKKVGCSPQNVIDASDNLFLYLGFLYRLFPKAKMVFIRRHPFDTITNIISNPQVLFESRTLEHTASFYSEADMLLKQYLEVLPIDLLTVDYEELWSQDPKTHHSIAKHLGITKTDISEEVPPFEKFALEPGRWKKFAHKLEMYKTAILS